MADSVYTKRIRAHLVAYKERELGVVESGIWEGPKGPVPRSHILPSDKLSLNVLPSIRESFWNWWENRPSASGRDQLHIYFAHLTSSQALAANLFYPWLAGGAKAQSYLLSALGLPDDEKVIAWDLEALPDPKEGTNVDCFIECVSKRRVLVEAKFTEIEFAPGKSNERRLKKLRETYAPRLKAIVKPEALDDEAFFKNYQLLRNLSFVTADSYVRFVVPKANTALQEGLTFLETAVLPQWRANVQVLFLEDLAQSLKTVAPLVSPGLASAVKEFEVKYLPTDALY
jgi:hypothetical protein